MVGRHRFGNGGGAARGRTACLTGAKLGVVLHWGLYSVPGWAPCEGSAVEILAEHPGDFLLRAPHACWYDNALRFPESATAVFHRRNYGVRPYASFRDAFEEGLKHWDPVQWAQLFHAAGARFVVLVAKGWDGYCLWPTSVPHPIRPGWHAPRDVVGELGRAVRAWGLRFGLAYSSGVDWSFDHTPVRSLAELLAAAPRERPYRAYVQAQYRELVERYQPDILLNDPWWPGSPLARRRLVASYRKAVAGGLVNDRWCTHGAVRLLLRLRMGRRLADAVLARRARARKGIFPCSWGSGDFQTPEHALPEETQREDWVTFRPLGLSYGWNQNESSADIPQPPHLIRLFLRAVAKGGCLALGIGPTSDGTVPSAQQERLLALGRWLGRYGEGIYESRPWREGAERSAGDRVQFTIRGRTLYALVLDEPRDSVLELPAPPSPPDRVRLPGGGELSWRTDGQRLVVTLPRPAPELPFVVALDGAARGVPERGRVGESAV